MNLLPKWALANPFPAIHDFESLTVIEQTARVYGAMQTLITEYNSFAEAANEHFASFTEEEAEARKEFELQITKVMNEFMCSMNQYLKINLPDTANALLKDGIESGSIAFPTDPTLAIAGVPADSGATGNAIAEAARNLAEALAVERARITNMSSLPEGSTTGDAELADIRTGTDARTHTSAGEAIRTQFSDIRNGVGFKPGAISPAALEGVTIPDGCDIMPMALSKGVGGWMVDKGALKWYNPEIEGSAYEKYRFAILSVEKNCTYVMSHNTRWYVLTDEAGNIVASGELVRELDTMNATLLYVSYEKELDMKVAKNTDPKTAPAVYYVDPAVFAMKNFPVGMLSDVVVPDGYNLIGKAVQTGFGMWGVTSGRLTYYEPIGSYANYRFAVFDVDTYSLYTFPNGSRWVVLVDESGMIVDYGQHMTEMDSMTAKKMYVTIHKDDEFVVVKGSVVKSSDFRYKMPGLLAESSGETDEAESAVVISVPHVVYLNTDKPYSIYFRNIITPDRYKLWIGSAANLTTKYYDDRIEVLAMASGAHDLPYSLYDENNKKVKSGKIRFIAASTTDLRNTSALVIGDSFTNAGYITQELLDLFAGYGKTVNLIGTRGEGANKHEGRGGWTAKEYFTAQENGGAYTNAFYFNGSFDFAKYMEANGYASVENVVIQLGTNDIFSAQIESYDYTAPEIVEYFDKIIENIHEYNRNISVIISLLPPPNSNLDAFTNAYETRQMEFVNRHNTIRLACDLAAAFANKTNVYVAAANCSIDTGTEISDGVHPTPDGYKKIAGAIFNAILNIQ